MTIEMLRMHSNARLRFPNNIMNYFYDVYEKINVLVRNF